MERGLRQSCPLSQLLFYLVPEALPNLLNQFHYAGWLSGIAILGLTDRMTVLQFVDDNILFLNNTKDISSRIQSCLTIFSILTGFKINLGKNTTIGVGRNLATAHQITSDLRRRVDNFPLVYLGILFCGWAIDCSSWELVVDMFRAQLSQWKCWYLSMEGRLILLKFVLCSLSIYSLSVKVLLMRVQNNLQSFMSRFLWGRTDERRKLHLVDWKTMALPCENGGLGVMDLANMNAALLAKRVYRYANNRDHLWRRVVCAKSGLDQGRMLLVINQVSRRSVLFNLLGIIMGRNNQVSNLINSSFRVLIGNGVNVNIWNDNWMGQ